MGAGYSTSYLGNYLAKKYVETDILNLPRNNSTITTYTVLGILHRTERNMRGLGFLEYLLSSLYS